MDTTLPKFTEGEKARKVWKKVLDLKNMLSVADFNKACENVFIKAADIVLDPSDTRQATLMAIPIDKKDWEQEREKLYIFVKDGKVVKIGGTRTGMKKRFGSYLCGRCVPERNKKKSGQPFGGKMSVTNAHLYHTIEENLLQGESKWEIYTWELPVTLLEIKILGESQNVMAQTYHAYESTCIGKYKKMTGYLPILCDNCDPNYLK